MRRATAAEEAERLRLATPAREPFQDCFTCPNYSFIRADCRVLIALQTDCFVLRQAKANAERGIEPHES